jgi:hypothetical protein
MVAGAGGIGGGLWLQAPSPKIALAIATATRTLTKGIIEYSLLSLLVAGGILSNLLQLTTKICFIGSRTKKLSLHAREETPRLLLYSMYPHELV